MIDFDFGLVMVFNGVIYNYFELCGELESFGYWFFFGGDIEVFLKGYYVWGVDLLFWFNGMFVFVVWECDCQWLFLVCD